MIYLIIRAKKKSKFQSCFLEIREGEFEVIKEIGNKKFFKSERFKDLVDKNYINDDLTAYKTTVYHFQNLIRYYEVKYEGSKKNKRIKQNS